MTTSGVPANGRDLGDSRVVADAREIAELSGFIRPVRQPWNSKYSWIIELEEMIGIHMSDHNDSEERCNVSPIFFPSKKDSLTYPESPPLLGIDV